MTKDIKPFKKNKVKKISKNNPFKSRTKTIYIYLYIDTYRYENTVVEIWNIVNILLN